MLPVHPEIIAPEALPAEGVLAAVAIPLRQFGAPRREVWRSPLPVVRSQSDGVATASNGEVLFGTISGTAGDTEALTERLYERIVKTARQTGYPYLLRVWNHVGGINENERGLERYRRFSAGRYAALARLGYERTQFPAACAVGMTGEGVMVNFLASRTAGGQVENPRQVPAYEYPPQYGPRSPSFSRATVARWDGEALMFLSGTSSVVGHETLHAGNVEAQTEETLRNLEAIVAIDSFAVVKTYIRRAEDFDLVSRRVMAALPRAQHLFLQADICRSDLLVQIEGVASSESIKRRAGTPGRPRELS